MKVVRSSFIRAFRRLWPAAFQPSRLGGVLVVMALGLMIFVAMNYVLGFALGEDAALVHPRQRPLGGPMYERIWSRMSAIDRLYQTGQLPPDTRLGVYMGVSTTATGIQRRFLDARATTADRWIVLSGAGMSFENIESVMHPVFFCSMKPATVVLGVHPQMLVGERYLGDEPIVAQARVVGRRRRGLKSHLPQLPALNKLPRHWIVRNHAMVEHFLRSMIYAWRLGAMYSAGATAEKLRPPATEPWDEDPLWLWNMNDAESRFAQDQADYWRRQGQFKAASYDPDGAQAQSLVRMIQAYRQLGAEVYLVIMPLRSTLRSLVPPNAKPCLYEVLNRAFPEKPPTVIDLEEAIPDRLFTDQAHLTKAGAERLSRIVASRLQAPSEEADAETAAP